MNSFIQEIIDKNRPWGWIIEPEAKAIMEHLGFNVPKGLVTDSFDDAVNFLEQAPGKVVLKAVSPKIIHKTEYKAVVTDIANNDDLILEMKRLMTLEGCDRVLVEYMIKGIEIIVGSKDDFHFGHVVLLGVGGSGVEIYSDTAISMAPVSAEDVEEMVDSLIGSKIFTGFRGKQGVNMKKLIDLVTGFSNFIMSFDKEIETIDLNPVICTDDACIIADARIMLKPRVLSTPKDILAR